MASFVNLLAKAQALTTLKDPDTEALVENLLGLLLNYEGPPVTPIPDVSEEISLPKIIRSPKGRPWAVAQTWITGPWRCLLLETASVPMGRPITLKAEEGKKGRTITDSRSLGFQNRIVMACHQLGISAPIGEGAVHTVLGTHRSFLAWRSREEDESMNRDLRGDADNFAKNILDGLQRAGVLPNDRGVFRLTATKDLPEGWDRPPVPLEEALRQAALELKAKGTPFETICVELRLSRAHMGRIFADYDVPRSARAMDPAQAQAKAKQAFDLILKGTPYKQARLDTGAPGTLLRERLVAHLRPRVLQGKTTAQDLAKELGLDARTAAGFFRNDKEARRALQQAAANSRTSAKRAPSNSQALLDAVKAVQAGTPPPVAAANAGVSVNSLYSKLNRNKAKDKDTKAPAKVLPKKAQAKKAPARKPAPKAKAGTPKSPAASAPKPAKPTKAKA